MCTSNGIQTSFVQKCKRAKEKREKDFVKEVLLKFREAEIDHLAFSASEKEELKSQWKQWLDATTHGIKDELRREGKLG